MFRFKQFNVHQSKSAMKLGTDAMLLGALLKADEFSSAIDVGCGTGVISLMLAQRYSNSHILGVDIDEQTTDEAAFNFASSPWSDRLSSACLNYLSLDSSMQFDLVFSNPPYYQSKQINTDSRKAAARHECAMPVSDFWRTTESVLSTQGSVWVIVPYNILLHWVDEAHVQGFHLKEVVLIEGKRGGGFIRVVAKFKRYDEKRSLCIGFQKMVIREDCGAYTDEYISLTKPYHFNQLKSVK